MTHILRIGMLIFLVGACKSEQSSHGNKIGGKGKNGELSPTHKDDTPGGDYQKDPQSPYIRGVSYKGRKFMHSCTDTLIGDGSCSEHYHKYPEYSRTPEEEGRSACDHRMYRVSLKPCPTGPNTLTCASTDPRDDNLTVVLVRVFQKTKQGQNCAYFADDLTQIK